MRSPSWLTLLVWVCSAHALRLVHKSKKMYETVLSGSRYLAGSGSIFAPPTFPAGKAYTMDRSSYIFILENVDTHGSVHLTIDYYDLHPNSWITIRFSKYGGYRGGAIVRYNNDNFPPRVIRSRTCCMRIEIQTGCCKPAARNHFIGLNASYRFLPSHRQRGRTTFCKDPSTQLCNGECIPRPFTCPCPEYGQYRCSNKVCVATDKICNYDDDCGDGSDETFCRYTRPRLSSIEEEGPLYGLKVVFITVTVIVLVVALLLFALYMLEHFLTRKYKETFAGLCVKCSRQMSLDESFTATEASPLGGPIKFQSECSLPQCRWKQHHNPPLRKKLSLKALQEYLKCSNNGVFKPALYRVPARLRAPKPSSTQVPRTGDTPSVGTAVENRTKSIYEWVNADVDEGTTPNGRATL